MKWGRERWCDREWEVWSGGNGGYDLGRVRAADESVNGGYVCYDVLLARNSSFGINKYMRGLVYLKSDGIPVFIYSDCLDLPQPMYVCVLLEIWAGGH